MSTEKPCDYCGTPIDEDDTEESFAPAHGVARTTHFAAVCRERVHAALRGEKRAHAETRAALAESQRAVAEARDKALEACEAAAADFRKRAQAELDRSEEHGRRDDFAEHAVNCAKSILADIRALRTQPPESASAPEDARADLALAMAADYLYGDNLPSGAEIHIQRLAALLDDFARLRAPAKRDGGT